LQQEVGKLQINHVIANAGSTPSGAARVDDCKRRQGQLHFFFELVKPPGVPFAEFDESMYSAASSRDAETHVVHARAAFESAGSKTSPIH